MKSETKCWILELLLFILALAGGIFALNANRIVIAIIAFIFALILLAVLVLSSVLRSASK